MATERAGKRTLEELFDARERLGPVGSLDFLIRFELTRKVTLEEWCPYGASHVNANHLRRPEVSVVMTAFNSANTIATSIESVLKQTLKNLELIVVDDFSSDETRNVVKEFAERDPRVRLLECRQNRGTYWAKNLGILSARADYVALHDSDDTSDPRRLERQLEEIERSGAELCYANWVRINARGEAVLNRGLYERLGFPTAMLKRSLVDKIGFFDSARIAADDEFHHRVKHVLGESRIAYVQEALYKAPLACSSLTGRNPVHMELQDRNDPLSYLSDSRKCYVMAYRSWHAQHSWPVMPFPLRERRFDAPTELVTNVIERGEHVVGSIASIPRRVSGLERVVNSILPQVDSLRVHLNGYEHLPRFLKHPKITVTRSNDTGDIRDNGKFLSAEQLPEGYHITLDDDLEYPPYYVPYLVSKILQYDKKVIVGVHGTILNRRFKRYHDDLESRKTFHYRKALENDTPVHVLGTGTTAYHTSAIRFGLGDIPSTGMVDLWLAVAARRQHVPMVCVSRGACWLEDVSGLPGGSLYEEYRNSDQVQTALLLRERLHESPPITP